MPDEAEFSAKFIADIQRYTNIFNILTPKLRSKDNKDRECRKITEVYLILLSLRRKNFLKHEPFNWRTMYLLFYKNQQRHTLARQTSLFPEIMCLTVVLKRNLIAFESFL